MTPEEISKSSERKNYGPDAELLKKLGLNAPKVLPLIERERSYIISLDKLAAHLDLRSAPSILITQRYFASEQIELIGQMAAAIAPCDLPQQIKLTQARLRTTKDKGGVSHFVQAKGVVPALRMDERIEISAKIQEGLFANLLPMAGAGFISKERFLVPGAIFDNKSNQTLVVAEINLIKAAGKNPHQVNNLNFALIDVEVPNRELYDQLVKGSHDIPLLHDAVDISALDKPVKEVFSNKRIAARGLGLIARQTAKGLLNKS